jgi:hypothetical protein
VATISTAVTAGGQPCPSKEAFREALDREPQTVLFASTSQYGIQVPRGLRGDQLGGWLGRNVLQVVGPDPDTDRQWHASVLLDKGRVRVV